MTRRGATLFAAMCVIWGIPYLLIRVAVRELTPVTLVFGRTLIAALILLPLALWRSELHGLTRRALPLLAFTVIEIVIPWLLLSHAETRLSSSLTGLLIAAVPLVGAVVTTLTGDRERHGTQRWVGLGVGMLGVAAIVGVVAASLVLATILYAPFALYSLPDRVPGWKVDASVVTLAVVCTALAFVVFFALIADVGPVRATVITYVNPAVAAVLGVVVLGEHFTVGMAIGFALVLAGSVLATAPRRERLPEPAAVGAPVNPS